MREERVNARIVYNGVMHQHDIKSPCPFCALPLALALDPGDLKILSISGGCDHLAGYSFGSTATAIEHMRFTFIYHERNGD